MARRPHRSPRKASHAFWTDSHHDLNIPTLDIRIEPYGLQYNSIAYKDNEVNNNVNVKKIKGNKENNNNADTKINKEPESHSENEPNYNVDADDLEILIRKNVWSDLDDDEYIAEKFRTSDRVKRESASVSDSEVVNSDRVRDMWEIEPADLTECDCLGPPPEFLLPPPPRPPFLHADYYCGDDPIPDLETCDTEPKIDAYNHSSPSLQTSAAIALCSVVLLLGILIGAVLVWKHKRKVTNLFPSKSSTSASVATANSCRLPIPAPLYEDLPDLPHRTPHRQNCEPQLEMVESKRGPGCGGSGRVFVCGAGNGAGTWRAGNSCGGDTCGAPLYEELPHRSDDSLHSDDHFAEDELSLVGEIDPRLQGCRSCPPRPPAPHSLPHRQRPQRLDRRPRSLERRRAAAQHRQPRLPQGHPGNPEGAEFHEGVLLDALLRLYPSVGTVGARAPPPVGAGGAWPGGDLPGLGCWRGPRASPKPPSGDSSFGSDSGYSNNTCGTCGTRASSRHRLSAEMPMS